MAMDLTRAQRELRRTRANLQSWQRKLYEDRCTGKPQRVSEMMVLAFLTQAFNMQQCVKRLQREEVNKMQHWRAFI